MKKQDINKYIKGLNYDARSLLSTISEDHPETLPGKSKTTTNSVIICTNKKRDISNNIDEISLLSPSNGIVFPGAIVRANRSLAEGKPQAVAINRAAVKILINLPGMDDSSVVIENPTFSNVVQGVDKLVRNWIEHILPQGYDHSALVTSKITKAYSDSQLSLDLGFNASWADNSIKSQFKFEKTANKSTTIAMFKQVFYTVAIDPISTPADAFDEEVSLEDIKSEFDDTNPPAYVESVDYGRMIMVRMDTESSATKTDLEATLKYATKGGLNISSEDRSKYESLAKSSSFSITIIGGGAKISSKVIYGGDFDEVRKILENGIQLNKDNPGLPIAYKVNFLKDHQLATMPVTASYVETECIEHPSGYIELAQYGWYVGKWEVEWDEHNEKGEIIPQSFSSGEVTSPYKKIVILPGDAHNVRIKAFSATGLFWDPWREAINKVENGPTNYTYEISGTSLEPTSTVIKNS
ncbi:thiol-activated cytolysin family protein [Chryseobacterium taiwanense]|uniref:Thiol-activated cytolysin C-terminal domain-containing protein n=1 Tax=Chryseobacterium taiwanense TaxID=363331 RepID=A0A0B4CN80_9FLAO|nr:thiol-activated cytolysin family protein [Chryseobacterium taiwanense]KIC62714.1 hypothetical protein RM51_11015 [Chryseobacterium taiwanense]